MLPVKRKTQNKQKKTHRCSNRIYINRGFTLMFVLFGSQNEQLFNLYVNKLQRSGDLKKLAK